MFERLRMQAPRAIDDLRAEVRAHAERIRLAMGANALADPAVAFALASEARALIDEAERRQDGETHRLVQAAVMYFVLDEDAEHDLYAAGGLDDDAAVLNAVARSLGREDLVVEF